MPGSRPVQSDPVALQTEIQRYADEYARQTIMAIDRYAESLGTDEARHQALVWKVAVGLGCLNIASGPKPIANLLDLLALATITRTVLETDWTKTAQGEAFQPWLLTSRNLETNAWQMADAILTPEQQQELRDSIRQWWEANPRARTGFFVRPHEFTSLIRQTSRQTRDETRQPGNVFRLAGLDPTAGLDPAVREITRTRLFAERAMFTAQRMPLLMQWQIELLTSQLLQDPRIALVLTNSSSLAQSADRFSRASESFSLTAAQLPDRLTAERQAILAALEVQDGRLRELAAEVSRALASGEKMSTSLNTTLITFDALMKRFGVGEPSTNAGPAANPTPFNILDYAQTAEQVGSTARDLNSLVTSVDQSLPQLERLSQTTARDAQKVVDRAFWLGLALIVVLLAGAVVAGLVYRFFAEKLKARGHEARALAPPALPGQEARRPESPGPAVRLDPLQEDAAAGPRTAEAHDEGRIP